MKYFVENKKLVQENKELRMLVKNKDSIIEELNMVVKRATKKYLKEKATSGRK